MSQSPQCAHEPTAPIYWHGHELTAVCKLYWRPIRQADSDKATPGPWRLAEGS